MNFILIRLPQTWLNPKDGSKNAMKLYNEIRLHLGLKTLIVAYKLTI